MKRSILRFSWNSIRVKLIVGVVLLIIPLIALLHFYNFYALRVVQHQVTVSNHNMMSLYMGQMDMALENVNQYLYTLASSDLDVQIIHYRRDPDEYSLAKHRLTNKLKADLLMYKNVNCFFVYSEHNNDFTDAIQNVNYTEYERVKNDLKEAWSNTEMKDGAIPGKWNTMRIGDENYLLRIQKTGDLVLGAWINVRTLVQPLALINLGESGVSVIAADNGNPLSHEEWVRKEGIDLNRNVTEGYYSGLSDQYYVIGANSNKGQFKLAAIIPKETVFERLPYLNRIVTMMTILGVLMLPLLFLFLRKTVLNPLNLVISAMRRIGDGQVQIRIEPNRASDEFVIVHQTFNTMMEQIEQLKINVYEEQLDKQKAELQHLQLQINPHFFLNTLNLIYNLAMDKDYELIKEMSMCLVRYFRYMFISNLTLVSLKDELDHVRNYIRIQELRYQQQLDCEIQTPEELKFAQVPPLVIQTFIENSVKHASNVDEPLRLTVTIQLDESSKEEPYLSIRIRDYGQGIPEPILSELNAGRRIVDEQGEHIGVWNVWHRLRLLYGERAQIAFTNAEPSGALVIMKLPLQPVREWKGG